MDKRLVLFCILIIIVSFFCESLADCAFDKYDAVHSPIFIEYFGKYEAIASSKNHSKIIQEGSFIRAHCPSGFRTAEYESTPYWIQISCKNDELFYSPNDVSLLQCQDNKAKLYENRHSLCPDVGYFYGFYLDSYNIILAEFCYNFGLLDTLYIHYVAGHRSPVLQRQLILNPTNNTELGLGHAVGSTIPGLPYTLPPYFSSEYNYNYSTINFEIDELVPFKQTAHIFKEFLKNEESNRVVWWKPLKNENWAKFIQILYKKSRSNIFDVYAGKTGVVKHAHKDCELEQELIYEIEEKERTVPLYIWNYIVPREDKNNAFVVIGVNTPFFVGGDDRKTIFCEDMCDQIEWMDQLKKTRKMPSLGYIFCCKPIHIRNVLDGFPKESVVQVPVNHPSIWQRYEQEFPPDDPVQTDDRNFNDF